MQMKTATTLDQQISLLRKRDVEIPDEDKAKECLLDIGYYRLGSYLFPFELSYPTHDERTHKCKQGTNLKDAVDLYYFDFDLRIILIRYITRIEVAFRTYITYKLSNKFLQSPTWFVDPSVVNYRFIDDFQDIYNHINKKPVIKRHHSKYINDKYAPAWKTLEYMTLGDMASLYKNLKNIDDKSEICQHFGVRQSRIFENYIETIRLVRNTCAHGGVLFDIKLSKRVRNGPAGTFTAEDQYKLSAALKIVKYLLNIVSINRQKDMDADIRMAFDSLYSKNMNLRSTVESTSGITNLFFD